MGYIVVLHPIIVGLLPKTINDKLHKWNLRGKSNDKGIIYDS